MVKVSVIYQGDKHCLLTHGPSQSQIETDAPVDNNGRGERFSPTDLMGAALGSCALTVMAIAAEKNQIPFSKARCEVEKEMNAHPRRVRKLAIQIWLSCELTPSQRELLEVAAQGCPVHKSLHPDIESPLTFHYE